MLYSCLFPPRINIQRRDALVHISRGFNVNCVVARLGYKHRIPFLVIVSRHKPKCRHNTRHDQAADAILTPPIVALLKAN